jgi:hypothetical protein
MKNFVGFVQNRSSGYGLLSLDGWLFYPRGFALDYHPQALLGAIAGVLVLVAALSWRGAPVPLRALLISVVVMAGLVMVHPYKESRFLFLVAPVLWLTAAWVSSLGIEKLASGLGMKRGRASVAVAALALGAVAFGPPSSPELAVSFERSTVPAEVAVVLDRVTQLATEESSTLLLGTSNQLSPALVEWHAALAEGVVTLETRVPSAGGGSTSALRRELGDVDSTVEQIVVLDAASSAPASWRAAFEAETQWLQEVRSSLEQDSLPYVLTGRETYRGAGCELSMYRRH